MDLGKGTLPKISNSLLSDLRILWLQQAISQKHVKLDKGVLAKFIR
jgi:hypothetical protein